MVTYKSLEPQQSLCLVERLIVPFAMLMYSNIRWFVCVYNISTMFYTSFIFTNLWKH